MKTFSKQGRQGDVLFTRIAAIPAGARVQKFEGATIVAHSETGHHHAFAKGCGVTYYVTNDPMVAYLSVEEPSLLEHHRSFDTHAGFVFEPGCYELRRPREYVSPEEQRMVVD